MASTSLSHRSSQKNHLRDLRETFSSVSICEKKSAVNRSAPDNYRDKGKLSSMRKNLRSSAGSAGNNLFRLCGLVLWLRQAQPPVCSEKSTVRTFPLMLSGCNYIALYC